MRSGSVILKILIYNSQNIFKRYNHHHHHQNLVSLKLKSCVNKIRNQFVKVGKYNFPSTDAFVGEKQTTFVDFAGFTPFLQTYCHNVQNVSQVKNIANINLNRFCSKCYPAKTEI